MLPAVIVVVYALAVARVTRLITSDRLTAALRARLTLWLWRRQLMPAARNAIETGTCTNGAWGCADAWAKRAMADGGEPPLSVYLLTCSWCASVYVGFAAAPLAYWWGEQPWLLVPALALAFSHITGLLAKSGG